MLGAGLQDVDAVRIDGTETSFVLVSAGIIDVLTPALGPGEHTLEFINGESTTAFMFSAAPADTGTAAETLGCTGDLISQGLADSLISQKLATSLLGTLEDVSDLIAGAEFARALGEVGRFLDKLQKAVPEEVSPTFANLTAAVIGAAVLDPLADASPRSPRAILLALPFITGVPAGQPVAAGFSDCAALRVKLEADRTERFGGMRASFHGHSVIAGKKFKMLVVYGANGKDAPADALGAPGEDAPIVIINLDKADDHIVVVVGGRGGNGARGGVSAKGGDGGKAASVLITVRNGCTVGAFTGVGGNSGGGGACAPAAAAGLGGTGGRGGNGACNAGTDLIFCGIGGDGGAGGIGGACGTAMPATGGEGGIGGGVSVAGAAGTLRANTVSTMKPGNGGVGGKGGTGGVTKGGTGGKGGKGGFASRSSAFKAIQLKGDSSNGAGRGGVGGVGGDSPAGKGEDGLNGEMGGIIDT